MKICSKCKEPKMELAFSFDRRNTDGFQSQCRDCIAAHSAKRRRESRTAPTKDPKRTMLKIWPGGSE